jgi:hypothetical protein
MVEEWRETRIHGRLGWNAMPFALEDLDSNFVSIPEEDDILATMREAEASKND